MRSLDEDLEDLSELDGYRVQSAEWRDAGRAELANRATWDALDAPMSEYSLTLRALLVRRPEEYEDVVRRTIHEQLSDISIGQLFGSKPDDMPILRAARIMHALVSGPVSPFHRLVTWCYYRLVREFHSAHAPEWITGGARAGESAAPTAYATGECVRAVSALTNVLERLATTLSTLATITSDWQATKAVRETPEEWKTIETQRVAHQLLAELEPHRANDALRIDLPSYQSGSLVFDHTLIESAMNVEAAVQATLDTAEKEFRDGLADIEKFRETECGNLTPEAAVHTLSAHKIAVGVVERALQAAEQGRTAFETSEALPERLRALSEVLRESAARTRRVVRPAVAYLSRVVDHELAAAASDDSAHCDVPELAFAAASYGAASGLWHDERLRRAAMVIASRISERGLLPFGRPLRPSQYGYKAHAIGSEALRAFSQILENVSGVDVEPRIVKRMMMYFQDRVIGDKPGMWRQDDAPHGQPPQRWSTAFAVVALDRINRMLDRRINERILKHFSWRPVSGPGLEQLFYPDYGLVHHEVGGKRDSLAIILERMRAHVTGIPRRYDQRDPVYSLILHGPGGTGKTTMVEALAKSARVPLVEVTPSDIVIGGVDAVERRTRAVFKALALLTRAVILFDEFDPILQARDPHATGPASVFSFLTPGMLPKLKTLHEAAKKRSLAYILSTNLIGKLDNAAIREGRFDVRAGVYPPDLLSRTGRFHTVLAEYERRVAVLAEPAKDARQMKFAAYQVGIDSVISLAKEKPPTMHRPQRIRAVLVKTRRMSMNTLGRRGWYSAPVEELRGTDDAFAYVFGKTRTLTTRPIDDGPKINGRGPEAFREWQEWSWIEAWDEVAAKTSTIPEALASRPPIPKQPHVEKFDLEAAASHCETCRHMAEHLVAHNHAQAPKRGRKKREGPSPEPLS